MALHKDLTGADLHEPKGQASAAANTVYVANGAGSGTHQKIALASLDLTSVQNPNTVYVEGFLDDVSNPSFIIIPAPEGCTFVSAQMFLSAGITVANAIVSFTRNDGSSFGSSVTITQAGSTEGTPFSFTATLNQTITNPGYVKVTTDGGSTTTARLHILCKFTRIP